MWFIGRSLAVGRLGDPGPLAGRLELSGRFGGMMVWDVRGPRITNLLETISNK
jgi:hypothetical protein